jgi:multidrug efflux system membrane fusion protein
MKEQTEESTRATSASAREPRVFLKKYRIALIVGAICVVLLILLIRHAHHTPQVSTSGRGRGSGGQNGPVAVAVAVSVVAVVSGDIQVKIPALGTVTTLANVTVKTQISGILQKIAFTEGQMVRQGEFIAQIDPRPYEAALQQMQGALRHDQALLADAKLDLKRYDGMVKEDSLATQTLDTQRALVDQYEGTIESDEGQVKTAQVNLIYTHIVSPVSGRIGLRQVDQGNYVTPGDSNGIVVINQLQPISVIFPVPEDNVLAIMQRLHGPALTVEAYDRTNSAKLADGKLLTVDNQIDTTTGTVKLRAQFDNLDGSLFPNQFVNIQLLQEVLRNQLIIPNSAVRRGAPNGVLSTFVYVVNPDRTVSVRAVKLGVIDGERVAVTEGLAVGDVVVTEGGDRLRDGATVQLPGEAPSHPGAGTRPAGPGSHRSGPHAAKPQ